MFLSYHHRLLILCISILHTSYIESEYKTLTSAFLVGGAKDVQLSELSCNFPPGSNPVKLLTFNIIAHSDAGHTTFEKRSTSVTKRYKMKNKVNQQQSIISAQMMKRSHAKLQTSYATLHCITACHVTP